jgi:magnesium transporter
MLGRWRTTARRGTLPPLSDLIPRAVGRIVGGLSRPTPAPPTTRRHNPDAVVDCAVYTAGVRRPGRSHYVDAWRHAGRRRDAFVWLGLHEPDPATMGAIAHTYGLHDLITRQASSGGHRPTVARYDTLTVLVLRTARYVEHEGLTESSEVVDTGDVMLLVAPSFVITVRHGAAGALGDVRAELERQPDLLTGGPWGVAYAVCSRLVDGYLEVAAQVERDLEELEEVTFSVDRTPDIAHIYQLKREVVEFKRAVLPLQAPWQRLLEEHGEAVPERLRPYFADVGGRLSRAVERVAGFDDLLNSILQARLAQVAVDQNNDMRRIASWAAIAAVQTAIAGVYGMNFDNMPELHWKYGYPAVLLAMAVAAVTLHRRLRRVGWL